MRRLLLTLTLIILVSTNASGETLVEKATVLSGLFNAYAPSVLGPHMWIGGWLTEADLPYDKIYRSDLVNESWAPPVHTFERADAGVNDPSAVVAPAGTTNLYYTAIDKHCAPWPNCILTDNLTGVASSTDGGLSWNDHGTVIPKANGLGQCGAWAPSAIVVGSEVWVYYHGGNPSFGVCEYPNGTVFRSRFDDTGLHRMDTVVVKVPLPVVNVDVSRRPDGLLVMVANSPDLTRIYRFSSTDGLTWTGGGAPLVDAGVVWIPTPHVTWVDATHFDLWFGNAVDPGNTSIHQVERWRFAE